MRDLRGWNRVLCVSLPRDEQRDEEREHPHNSEDVRDPCEEARCVARIRPDESNGRPYYEQDDHRSEPVKNATPGDDLNGTPVDRNRQPFETTPGSLAAGLWR